MITFPVTYSTLNNAQLLHLITSNYAIAAHSTIQFIKRGFNDTYIITENDHKNYVLRVYKHNWKSIANIETEINVLNHLKENNISVSYPIAGKNNQYIQSVNAPEGVRYMVLFSFAEGVCIRKLTAKQCFLLGTETGKIHNLTQRNFSGETAFHYHFESQFTEILTTLKPVLKNYLEQYDYLNVLKDEFLNVWKSIHENEVIEGMCHGDLQAENFHISATDTITFFDFDFLGTGYLIYDIGVFIWYDHKNKTNDSVTSFLNGYQTQRKLTPAEIKLIPYFGTLRALFQMSLYCKTNDGNLLPLWPAEQVAAFIKKVNKWHETQKANRIYW